MTDNQAIPSHDPQGLYVAAVDYDNGFEVGDRIVAVNGAEVASFGQMQAIVTGFAVGETANVTVLRHGRRRDIRVPVSEADLAAGGVA